MSKKKKYITIIGLIIAILFSFNIFRNRKCRKNTNANKFIYICITNRDYNICKYNNINIKKLNTFAIAGISSSTIIYAIISLIVNILFVGVFKTIRTNLVFNFDYY